MSPLVRELWDALLRPSGAHGLDLADVAATGYYVRLLVLLDHQVRVSGGGSTLWFAITREASHCQVRKAKIEEWLDALSRAGLIRFSVTSRGVQVELLGGINRVNESTETDALAVPTGTTSSSHGNRSVPDGTTGQFPREPISPNGNYNAPLSSRARAEDLKPNTKYIIHSTVAAGADDHAVCGFSGETEKAGQDSGDQADRAGKLSLVALDPPRGAPPIAPAPPEAASPDQPAPAPRRKKKQADSTKLLEGLEAVYRAYPRKAGRREFPSRGFELLVRSGVTEADLPDLQRAVERYAASRPSYPLAWHNWVKCWRDSLREDDKAALGRGIQVFASFDELDRGAK